MFTSVAQKVVNFNLALSQSLSQIFSENFELER